MSKVLVTLLALVMSTTAMATGHKHMVEASLELDNRTIDYDNGGEADFDVFRILATYRNQYKKDLFLVGNLEFQSGNIDTIVFSGGAEINLLKGKGNMEAGAGGWIRLFTGDISGFGIRPYGFLRSFLTNNLFISSALSYDWAIVDVNGGDADLTGIMITAGFGYAF